MKELIEVNVNGQYQDAYIQWWWREKRDENGNIRYVDPVNSNDPTAYCKGSADRVIIYVEDKKTGKVQKIGLCAKSIQGLAKKIEEIEKQESEQFID
jgi:hypothetical protein